MRAQERASKERHAEAVRQRKALYFRQNRDRLLAEHKAYYEATRDRHAEVNRQRYERNREQVLETVRRYRKANPDKVAARRTRYRMQKEAQTVEVFDPAEIFHRDGWICQLCQKPIDPAVDRNTRWGATLDHIVPIVKGGEHSRANSQAAHKRCNSIKRDRLGPVVIS